MKHFFFPLLGFILLMIASCESDHPVTTSTITSNSQTMQAVISMADSNYVIIQNSEHPAEISDEELTEIDTLLNTCINHYNAEKEQQFKEWVKTHPKEKTNANPDLIDLPHYMLQYLPSMNNKGEKEIHIEGLCDSFDKNWKTLNPDMILDGDKCFFSLTINLHSKTYSDFGIHSEV
jgi:hypothetical protein